MKWSQPERLVEKKKLVRSAFLVHFALGAFLGLFLGLNLWIQLELPDSVLAGAICTIGGSLACGTLLGLAKVKFDWDNFSKRGKNW